MTDHTRPYAFKGRVAIVVSLGCDATVPQDTQRNKLPIKWTMRSLLIRIFPYSMVAIMPVLFQIQFIFGHRHIVFPHERAGEILKSFLLNFRILGVHETHDLAHEISLRHGCFPVRDCLSRYRIVEKLHVGLECRLMQKRVVWIVSSDGIPCMAPFG